MDWVILVPVTHLVEGGTSKAKVVGLIPREYTTDKMFALNALQVPLGKSVCQMDECKFMRDSVLT